MGFSIEAKFYILILTFLCTASAAYVDPSKLCPPRDFIEPCTCGTSCSHNPTVCSVSIDCLDIDDQEVLSRVFAIEYKYHHFYLKQASVLYLPDSLFEVRGLETLRVDHSSVVSLFNHTTTADNSINVLTLMNVQILRGFDWKMLAGFHHMVMLQIRKTKVPKIDQSFVDNAPKSLAIVEIVDCSTTTIHDRAFAGLPELSRVYVRDGKIKEVKRSMFPASTQMWVLDLSGNRISSLPDDMFSGMPRLEHLYLSGNLLTEISENVFRNLFLNLVELLIENNPLKCQCNIRWITNARKPPRFLGTCMEPKNMHGKSIRDLVPGDFVHCA